VSDQATTYALWRNQLDPGPSDLARAVSILQDRERLSHKIDAALEAARRTTDPASRRRAYRRVDKLEAQEAALESRFAEYPIDFQFALYDALTTSSQEAPYV
jgi:hypothetical protein